MPGRNVEFASNGGKDNGYLSTPASGSGPGVVVIQEWWGLNSEVRSIADRFASEGFVALAPDLYHGKVTREPDEAGKLMMALNVDQAAKDMRGAVDYLLAEGGATGDKVGVVGFCMGGQLALYGATVAADKVGAVVDFYGVHPNVKPDYSRLQGAFLGIFAEKDEWTPPAAARALVEQIRAAGKEAEYHVYPGADHAFFNDERPEVHAPEASEDAWRRTVEFFRGHLAGAKMGER